MNSQQIRRSQFIFTYGPGAIIEGDKGSSIIPSIENGLDKHFSDEMLEKFEINDVRMSSVLQRGIEDSYPRIFSLPSNAALNLPEYYYIYNTYPFPMWRICYNKNHRDPVLYKGKSCPICHNENSPNVRFVSACPEGHLDEVNWNWAVHKGDDCGTYYFYWKARGSSLADIVIQCANPKCKCSTDMQDIYSTKFLCSGRIPEQEDGNSYYTNQHRPQGCKGNMKVIQRQSTALRIPETFTLLTIPQYDTSTIRVLQRNDVKGPVKMAIRLSENKEKFIDNISMAGLSDSTIIKLKNIVDELGYEDFKEYTTELYEKKIDIKSVVEEEFESLRGEPRLTENFWKKKPINYEFPLYEGFNLDVYPVEKLRTVTVQLGYRRMPYMKKDGESKLVSSASHSSGSMWFPGFEGAGEGIFISSVLNPLDYVKEKAIDEWDLRKRKENDKVWQGSSISWRNGLVRHPQFVWWHSLAHALIRTLSLVSGYSSASLRERVYTDRAMNHGGILIYTSSAGEDGGMGGLVETALNFDQILRPAIESVLFCSNDPLCSEIRINNDSINGSACHNCLMLSETSCEHGNRWLDRHILTGD